MYISVSFPPGRQVKNLMLLSVRFPIDYMSTAKLLTYQRQNE